MNDESQQFTDIMVDIETTGTMPDRHNIIQIAAVKFNIHTGAVSADYFDRCLGLVPHRFWDEGTKEWWGKQKRSTIDNIYSRMEDPAIVMKDFFEFARPFRGLTFWGKPTHFDFSFIASYFKDFNMENPFHYRHANDCNTFFRALHFPESPPDLERTLSFDGDAHNALWDTFHQVKVVLEHVKQAEAKRNELYIVTPPRRQDGVRFGEQPIIDVE